MGDCFEGGPDQLKNSFSVRQHVVIPEAKYTIAIPSQFDRTHGIRFDAIWMLSAIKLDDELTRRTSEISDEFSNRMLAPKAPCEMSITQSKPETLLRVSRIASQLPS